MDEETEVGKDSKDLKQSVALVALSAILRYGSCRLASFDVGLERRDSKAHLSSYSCDPLVSSNRSL